MNFLDLVKRRQSVRKYSNRSVSREILNRCLEAARLAPSACNSQPWQFIIVDALELRTKLADAAFSGMFSMNAFAKDAPVLVVVVRDKSGFFARLGGQFRGVQYSLLDVGIAVEHFVLQAEEDGVGTCWLGWFDERAVKKVLGIPWDKKADIMLSVGYPADAGIREKFRKGMNEISKYNGLS